MTATRSVELAIEGMHCAGCVARLTATLKQVPGVTVESAAVGSAHVVARNGVTEELLAQAGFKVLEAHERNA